LVGQRLIFTVFRFRIASGIYIAYYSEYIFFSGKRDVSVPVPFSTVHKLIVRPSYRSHKTSSITMTVYHRDRDRQSPRPSAPYFVGGDRTPIDKFFCVFLMEFGFFYLKKNRLKISFEFLFFEKSKFT
jgi:hypothetical protein